MSDLEWRLRVWAEAYPEDIFPPLTDEEKAALPRGTIDRCSAAMGRHIAGILIEAADRIAELEGRWTDKDCLRFAEAYHNMRFDGSENAVAIVARVRRGLAALREGEKG